MIGFDTATSSFLTLLINKSYKKLKKEFHWPVMVVKLRKGKKILKKFGKKLQILTKSC